MTDEQIVRTLAEFMGRWPSDVVGEPFQLGTGWAVAIPNGQVNTPCFLPSYPTSYDVIAEVWLRVQKIDPYTMLPMADKGIAYNWFDHTPREHAEALATAIKGAKP